MNKILWVFCLTFGHTIFAYAQEGSMMGTHGVYFQTNYRPVLVDQNDTGSDTGSSIPTATDSGLGTDLGLHLAYVYEGTYLLGLSYNYYNLATFRGQVTGGNNGKEQKTTATETGVTIGALLGSWRFLYTYYVGGQWSQNTRNFDSVETTGDTEFVNTGLHGYQVEIGIGLPIVDWFEIGGGLVYKSRSYYEQSKLNRLSPNDDSENYSSRKLYSKKIDNSLSPMVSMVFKF